MKRHDNKTDALEVIVEMARVVARRYYQITGKPLGITGEIGEYLAAHHLDLTLSEARQEGYDAETSNGERVQIKTRRVLAGSNPGQRIGAIKLDKEWDSVVLVLVDENYDPLEMYQAKRERVRAALQKPGSKARNKRGQLGLHKFKSISELVWSRGND